MLAAEEEQSPAPKQHAALKQQGVDPALVSQQVLMQHSGREPQPEHAAAVGRADADEPIEVELYSLLTLTCQHCLQLDLLLR